MTTLPLILSVETFIGLRGVLSPRGTFPISNLIPGLRLGFFKDTLFQKLWSHFLGFYFLFYFPFKNKNKISGDSNFFPKTNFSLIKSESRRLSGGAREKCESTVLKWVAFIEVAVRQRVASGCASRRHVFWDP